MDKKTLQMRYLVASSSYRLGCIHFQEWQTVQASTKAEVESYGWDYEAFIKEAEEARPILFPPPEPRVPYSIENPKWPSVKVGDFFTTEGLRGFCSGSGSEWEEVVRVDGEKIFLKGYRGENDWWSAIYGDHNKAYYTLSSKKQ